MKFESKKWQVQVFDPEKQDWKGRGILYEDEDRAKEVADLHGGRVVERIVITTEKVIWSSDDDA